MRGTPCSKAETCLPKRKTQRAIIDPTVTVTPIAMATTIAMLIQPLASSEG